MNRYNQLTYGTLNDLPLPTLPFEQLGALIGNYQKQKDFYDQQKEAEFATLDNESDKALAKQVNEYRENLSGQLADVYLQGNTKEYMTSLRGGVKNLLDLRKQGGAISALESRVQQFQKVKTELDEQFKEDVDKTNYKYALSQIKVGDIGYDAEARTFNSITKPTVQNFFDIQKRVDEAIKLIIPQEGEGSYIKDGWVWKENKKSYKVSDVVDSIMREPEVMEQLRIEAAYNVANMSEEAKSLMLSQQDKMNTEAVAKAKEGISLVNEYLTSGNADEIKKGQSILQQYGHYKGAIDGAAGPQTETAYKAFKESFVKRAESSVLPATTENLQQIYMNAQKDSYFQYFKGMRPDSYSLTIDQADWKAKLRAGSEAYKKIIEQYYVQPPADIVKIPNNVIPNEFMKTVGQTSELLQQSKTNIENIAFQINEASGLTDTNVFDPEEINDFTSLAERAVYVKGMQNKISSGEYNNDQVNAMKQEYARKYNLDPDKAAKQFEAFLESNELMEAVQERAVLENQSFRQQDLLAQQARKYFAEAGESGSQDLANAVSQLVVNQQTEPYFFAPSGKVTTPGSGYNNVYFDKQKNQYYREIPTGLFGLGQSKKEYLGITGEDISKYAGKSPQEIAAAIKTDPKLASILSVTEQKKIEEKFGDEISSMEMLNTGFTSKDFQTNPLLKTYSEGIYNGDFDNASADPFTRGSRPTWTHVENGKKKDTDVSLSGVSSFSFATVDGKAVMTIFAESDEGTFKKSVFIDQENLPRFQNQMMRELAIGYNERRDLDIDPMVDLFYPISNEEVTIYNYKEVSENSTPATLKLGAFSMPVKYEELGSQTFEKADGTPETYRVIVSNPPNSTGDKSKRKYFLVDGDFNIVQSGIEGLETGLEARHALNKIDLSTRLQVMDVPVRMKTESMSANTLLGMGLPASSFFGIPTGAPSLSGMED